MRTGTFKPFNEYLNSFNTFKAFNRFALFKTLGPCGGSRFKVQQN